jgi:hypothetical protein
MCKITTYTIPYLRKGNSHTIGSCADGSSANPVGATTDCSPGAAISCVSGSANTTYYSKSGNCTATGGQASSDASANACDGGTSAVLNMTQQCDIGGNTT